MTHIHTELNKQFFLINKPIGITPLQALRRFKLQHPELQDLKLTYAGRLDPAASGILPIVKAEFPLLKQDIIRLPKVYEAVVIFGVDTDSLDILGKVLRAQKGNPSELQIIDKLKQLLGRHLYDLPKYSSSILAGGKQRKVSMYVSNVQCLGIFELSINQIIETLKKIYTTLEGEFRQEEILQSWNDISTEAFLAVRVRFEVGSGTYIRSLAHELGKLLGVPAVLYSLTRIGLGDWHIDDEIVTIVS